MLPKIVGVVGAGQMGGRLVDLTGRFVLFIHFARIAQLAATQGMKVLLQDSRQSALDAGVENIAKSLSRFCKKGKISEEVAKSSLAGVTTMVDIKALEPAEFVIEAVTESENVKKAIFQSLDQITIPDAILASNTSSISITRIANATSRPEKVVGMHFMNPPPIMSLVELIKGMATSEETFAQAKELAEAMGKTVCTSEDRPGFIVNR